MHLKILFVTASPDYQITDFADLHSVEATCEKNALGSGSHLVVYRPKLGC